MGDTNKDDNRIIVLEKRVDNMSSVLNEISQTNASLAKSNDSISKTLVRVNDNLERFREFEIKSTAERKAEEERRLRLEDKIENQNMEIDEIRKDHKHQLDRVYRSVRNLDSRFTEKINDLFTQLTVKAAVDDVKQVNMKEKQESVADTVKTRGERLYKIGFWVVTTLFGLVIALANIGS